MDAVDEVSMGLIDMAREGKQNMIWRMMHEEPNLVHSAIDSSGGTALHAACAEGHTGTAQ
jgi:hypothetical protein